MFNRFFVYLFICLISATTIFGIDTSKLVSGDYALFKTSMGDILCELYSEQAPITVENFIGLATGSKEWKDSKTGEMRTNTPLYTNTKFHRVIPNFMIQGGDPLGTGRGGPGYRFPDEFHPDLKHDRPGRLSMANSGPNTNGSQFFITHRPTTWLDNKHTIFGQVIEGQDIVNKIGSAPKDKYDRPLEEIKLIEIQIITK